MRDPTKLRAFELADGLAVRVHRATARFPAEERFGLAIQMRRAAVSIASNIVEGSARRTEKDYVRFLDIAYASACELQYQVRLATRLGFLHADEAHELQHAATETARVLGGLLRSLRRDSH